MRTSLLNQAIVLCLALALIAPASQALALPQAAQQGGTPTNGAQQGGTQTTGAQQQPVQSQPPASNPVGTAVAPYEETSGVTASRPAGAVIAPAKQRRVRAILIKIGIVVGAAAAVGTVVALSHASPGQPH